MKDADGNLHAAVADIRGNGEAYYRIRLLTFEADGDGYVLTHVNLGGGGNGTRPIPVSELQDDMEGVKTACRVFVGQSMQDVPIATETFTIPAASDNPIRLVKAKTGDIPGIQDVEERYAIHDMYHHEFDITNLVKAADSEGAATLYNIDLSDVGPVVYNGRQQGPKLTYNGEVLE